MLAHPDGHDGGDIHRPSCFRSGCPHQEAGDILGGELDTDVGLEGIDAEVAEILGEVPKLGQKHKRLNADGGRPFDQAIARSVASWIVVADDVEVTECRRE